MLTEEDEKTNQILIELGKLEVKLGSRVLAKACFDKGFSYALQLRNGELFRFEGAEVVGDDWIHLNLVKERKGYPPFASDRGVEVRISQIVWVMDDPVFAE